MLATSSGSFGINLYCQKSKMRFLTCDEAKCNTLLSDSTKVDMTFAKAKIQTYQLAGASKMLH